MNLDQFLLILALVLFIVAAAGVSSRVNLVAAGLAAWVASLIF